MSIANRILTSACMLATLGVAAAGCASVAEASQPDEIEEPVVSETQAKAVADGVASEQEYREGFQRYQDCMSDHGYEVIVRSDDDYLIDMRIPGEAVDSGVDETCYELEFSQVDDLWQLANQDKRSDVDALRECMVSNDVVPMGQRVESMSRLDVVSALDEAEVDLISCVAPE
ncbi:MAG: hypothetical protein ACTHU7_00905 [Microbacterium sp.]